MKSIRTKCFIAFQFKKVSGQIRDKKSPFFMDLLGGTKNFKVFEIWSWDVIFVPFSDKVTCTKMNLDLEKEITAGNIQDLLTNLKNIPDPIQGKDIHLTHQKFVK